MSYLAKALKHGHRPNTKSTDITERRLSTVLVNYTNKNNICYDPIFDAKIRVLRPDWFENTADKKKEELLELARSGAEKPNRKTSLSTALGRYIRKNSECYDPVFDAKIQGLRPDWFENTADKVKEKLLELARSGAEKPSHGAGSSAAERKLNSSLHGYLHKNSVCYDPVFDKEIHRLRPDWFIKQSDKIKNKLLELAKTGAKRPSQTSKDKTTKKLGLALCRYTRHDPVFSNKIHKLRPDWFRSAANKTKEELIELARSGGNKPYQTDADMARRRLAVSLSNYTNKNRHYDPAFDKLIRELRPDWYETTTIKNKEELLEIAQSGSDRPRKTSGDVNIKRLAGALCCYTSKRDNSYDPVFAAKIRGLRPDWYENLPAKKKEKLLKIARSGAKRPRQTSDDTNIGQLATALNGYTYRASNSFDPVFDKKIRKLRPDWFRRRK